MISSRGYTVRDANLQLAKPTPQPIPENDEGNSNIWLCSDLADDDIVGPSQQLQKLEDN